MGALFYEESIRADGQDPAARLKYQSVHQKPVESLNQEECGKLIRWATTKAQKERFGGHRTAVLALLLLDTGLRVGEGCRLQVDDIGFAEGRILVRKTKTGDFRIVPRSLAMKKHVRRYLRRRERGLLRKETTSDSLFISESGVRVRWR